ncbi:helix-turn-helix domain-containing protein [Candidatus Erwinia dacicola]|nr:helix-turn-helix domain-containing protein [Candidatus Erwinia dacicola]
MMTLETRVEMSVLHRQGMSIRAIARQLSWVESVKVV